MMWANAIGWYYGAADVATDGGALPTHTVVGDATDRLTFSWAAMAGVWDYAVGWFKHNTTTASLRGVIYAVRTATANTILVDRPLPAAPQTGDTFQLCRGLRCRTGQRIAAQRINGYSPAHTAAQCRQISGVTICAGRVVGTDVYLRYDVDDKVLAISSDGSTWCGSLDVSGDVSGGYLEATDGSWLSLDVLRISLPIATTEERLLATPIVGAWVPPVWIDSENEDSVLHHCAVLRNDSEESGDVVDITLQATDTVGTALVAVSCIGAATTLTLSSVVGLPARDFWLYLNDSSGDLRYVRHRAANTCYLADTSTWQEVPFVTGSQAPTMGATLSAGSAGATLRAVYVTSGSWAGGDAAGVLVVSGADGLFAATETILEDSSSIAVVGGAGGAWAIRGFARQSSWLVGEAVQWYPPFDVLALSGDSTGEFVQVANAQADVPAQYAVWSLASEGYEGPTVSAFGPADVAALVLRRYLLSDLAGHIQLSTQLGIVWE